MRGPSLAFRSAAYIVAIAVLSLFIGACVEENDLPESLRETEQTDGPTVVFDLEAWPFPDVPFPNDVATRPDPSSPTGRRINVALEGATNAEVQVRRTINRQTGFGVFSPVSVEFDEPLELYNLVERHQQKTPDFSDDAVYLVNVDPDSDEFGTFELLDMGMGNYPLTMTGPDEYFHNDPRSNGTNLVMETVWEEDTNENGVFDPIEDTDDDGTFDVPNLLDPTADPYEPGQLLDWYERETNTLIMRPVFPLEQGTTYAVVLTSDLVGEDGNPVQSPFEGINHTRQTSELEPIRALLSTRFPERFSPELERVQFAWTFTTGTPTRQLEAVRAGLYGHGSLDWLADQYPAEFKLLHHPEDEDDDNPLNYSLDSIVSLIVPLAEDAIGGGGGSAEPIEEAIEDVDYVVSGSFMSPYFLADSDGLADPTADSTIKTSNPQDDDEIFDIDVSEGKARHRPGEVTFTCTVPEEKPGRSAPFPTIIYSHAISSTRLEMLAFAGQMAKFGFATCTIDAAGHGVDIPSEFDDLIDQLAPNLGLPGIRETIQHDRARDINNDGAVESGEDYFTAAILHSRDMIRQTTIDQLQLIRILRSFDGESRWETGIDEDDPYIQARRDVVAGWDADGDGQGEIRGDFNADGVVDFGGDVRYVSWGTSLGGLQTGVLAGIEPSIVAAASNAGGGGLGDIAVRTDIKNVRVGVFMRMFGPLLVGTRIGDDEGDNRMRLEWILPNGIDDERITFAVVDGVEDGDRIVLRNLERERKAFIPFDEREAEVIVRDGRFRVGIATDARSSTARRAVLGFDPSVSMSSEIMGCDVTSKCNGVDCEANNYCAQDGTCAPIGRCVPDFSADAIDDAEVAKQAAAHTIENPRDFGDPLVIEIRGADGEIKQTIDTFPRNFVYQNILYPEGAPLAALYEGWGLKRQTPRFRRFLAIAQTLLEPADPAVWAAHYFENPLEYPYEREDFQTGETNMLVVGTLGDQTVPISTGVAHARAAGIVDVTVPDQRYGKPENQFLIDNFVYEGIHWLNRFPEYPNTLYDPDDLDRGMFISDRQPDNPDPNPDATAPVRATVRTPTGISALRLPYLDTHGEHTFNVPRPDEPFDVPMFMANQVGWYLSNQGRELSDDPCLQELYMDNCEFFDTETYEPPSFQ